MIYFLKNKGVNIPPKQTTNTSAGTSSHQSYINPNAKRRKNKKI